MSDFSPPSASTFRSEDDAWPDDPFVVERTGSGSSIGMQALADVLARWKTVFALTVVTAVAAVGISLMLPVWYRAESRLLVPNTGSGLLGLLGGGSSAAAKAFLGGTTGTYTRLLALATSRSMAEAAIDSFALAREYETYDDPYPRSATLKAFRKHVTFSVDQELDFLVVSVEDRSPERAARIANFIADRLNATNSRLNAQAATGVLAYMQRRYEEAENRLDDVLDSTRLFQQRYGLVDVPAQAQAYFTQIAALRAQQVRAEVEYRAQAEVLGPEHPEVLAQKAAIDEARSAYARAEAGSEAVMPVARNLLPSVVRQYAGLERDRQIQAKILESLTPLLEQARFDEQREGEAVQVIDRAVTPERKDRPRRAMIVIAATLSALVLGVMLALLRGWWLRNRDVLRQAYAHARHAPPTADEGTLDGSSLPHP